MRKKLVILIGFLAFWGVGSYSLLAQNEMTVKVYTLEDNPDWMDLYYGASVNGVSPNGKYAVGHGVDYSSNAFIWNRETGEFTQITGSHDEKAEVYAVSNDGTVVGAFKSEKIGSLGTAADLPGYWKNGVWTELPLVKDITLKSGDINGWASGISADGHIITGQVKDFFYSEERGKNIELYRPAVWIDGVLQPAFKDLPEADKLQQGMVVFASSEDATILGGRADHPRGTRSPAIWIDGELIRIYGEHDIDPDVDDYFFDGNLNTISPDGKLAGGTYSATGSEYEAIGFIYDVEKREKKELGDPWYSVTVIQNDGTYYGTDGYIGKALIKKGDFEGTFLDYLKENYNFDEDERILPVEILSVSQDGKTLVGWYPEVSDLGVAMMPSVVVISDGSEAIGSVSGSLNHIWFNRQEIVAQGAEKIEIYDISGRKLCSREGTSVSVSQVKKGMVIAKAYYENGKNQVSKFVLR